MTSLAQTQGVPVAPRSPLSVIRVRAWQLAEWARFGRVHRQVAAVAGRGARSIYTHTHADELATLYRLAASVPEGANALEIGSHLGASACYIGAAIASRGGLLFCVDTWNNETMPEGQQDTMAAFEANTRALARVIRPIRKRSDALRESDVQPPLGFAFIDGDHSYEATRIDFATVGPWIRKGGIVAFHDAVGGHFPGVPRVIGMALMSGEWRIGGQIGSMFWIVRT